MKMVKGRGMKRIVVLVLMLVVSGCTPTSWTSPTTSATSPPQVGRITVLGDSLTYQYGPYFKYIAGSHGVVVGVRGAPGTNPVDHPWADWVNLDAPANVVVLQDFAILGIDVHHSLAEYLAAWQRLVDASRATLLPGGRIVVLDGVHPDLSTIQGIDQHFPMFPSDAPDGIHWTPKGAESEAQLLCQQLGICDNPLRPLQ